MAQFDFDVTETRTYAVRYTVEAQDLAEARKKAEKGDTVEDGEQEIRCLGVVDRVIDRELGKAE